MILAETRVHELLSNFNGRRVAIVGDVMLDRYLRGTVSRISPEAPVPVIDIEEDSEHPGGAANVGYNLAMLGVSPLLFGVVGDDSAGRHLRKLLTDLGIGDEGLITDGERPTTEKTRIIASSQHIARVDRERNGAISPAVQAQLVDLLKAQLGSLDAIILQDYNKGVIGGELITTIVELARVAGVAVYVDPKFSNFFEYRGVSVFKPNRKEAEDALHRPLKSEHECNEGARELLRRLECKHVILTLGADGMLIAQQESEPVRVPTRAIQVADVSGAGDTVIATLSAARAAGAGIHEAAVIANHAAGIVCSQVGTVPVQHHELLESLLGECDKTIPAGI